MRIPMATGSRLPKSGSCISTPLSGSSTQLGYIAVELGDAVMADTVYFSEDKSEEAVIARMDKAKVEPRLYEVMSALVKHLHAFIKEVEPTNEEWMQGIRFLTRTGQMCTDWRQEFILLSDTLGVSMLVETINNRKPSGATETTG